jgi:hypothetical protein
MDVQHIFNSLNTPGEVRWSEYLAFSAASTFCPGYAFNQDGRQFILAERHKSKDTIGVYDPNASFKLLRVSCSPCLPAHKDELGY